VHRRFGLAAVVVGADDPRLLARLLDAGVDDARVAAVGERGVVWRRHREPDERQKEQSE